VSAADRILDRLEHVRQTAPDRWLAKCPSHEDKTPSLSMRQLDDGRVLLYDFGGCSVEDILAAIGLELGDLFDQPRKHYSQRTRMRIPARDLLAIIDAEALTVGMIALQFRDGRQLSQEDWERLSVAIARIGRARDHGAPLRIDPRKTVYPPYAR
jgi:hypothetical protein